MIHFGGKTGHYSRSWTHKRRVSFSDPHSSDNLYKATPLIHLLITDIITRKANTVTVHLRVQTLTVQKTVQKTIPKEDAKRQDLALFCQVHRIHFLPEDFKLYIGPLLSNSFYSALLISVSQFSSSYGLGLELP